MSSVKYTFPQFQEPFWLISACLVPFLQILQFIAKLFQYTINLNFYYSQLHLTSRYHAIHILQIINPVYYRKLCFYSHYQNTSLLLFPLDTKLSLYSINLFNRIGEKFNIDIFFLVSSLLKTLQIKAF